MQDKFKKMSIETFGIPLAIFPYSNKSLIIQWLTKSSGLISTIYNTKNHFRMNLVYLQQVK